MFLNTRKCLVKRIHYENHSNAQNGKKKKTAIPIRTSSLTVGKFTFLLHFPQTPAL